MLFCFQLSGAKLLSLELTIHSPIITLVDTSNAYLDLYLNAPFSIGGLVKSSDQRFCLDFE